MQKKRINILKNTNDGFKISEEDMKLRGYGDLLGFKQSGLQSFRLADPVINEDLVNVFVPTTPNPTSGFLLMFPKQEIIYLDMTFEEASKFIVSAGTSNPK